MLGSIPGALRRIPGIGERKGRDRCRPGTPSGRREREVVVVLFRSALASLMLWAAVIETTARGQQPAIIPADLVLGIEAALSPGALLRVAVDSSNRGNR